ncbi:putative mRNA cleavage factor complex component pcf11 [Rosellinia necatrix]|uniref:Putative mRNA cleavage factor complex component pcf11 n=1 Tax=Rosellinia necatrix TaxID=77044 RepID=A0A1S7UKK6_ROSNE|nr:putative mRNA cleavage factor complex component pcf11 [Rosellinia necatrix]
MSSYSESDDVAKDFREALEDIQTIGRPEISNLTIIARENIEHALAISSTLVDHVKRAAPHKKLPPLYVLDSIAKNVGTPYTLFFSRKLYQTYMDAYAMVDMATRRKLEEMLKTWKEPVPGSIDTRPVFPPEVVRPIENALIKVRTTTLQQDQERMRNQQQLYSRGRPGQGVPYRETPTPPGARPPPQAHGYHGQQPPMQHPNGAPYSQPTQPPPVGYQSQPPTVNTTSRSTPQPPSSSAFQPPHMGGYGLAQRGISIDALNDDIQRLTAAFKAQLAQGPHDPVIQTKFKALMDLQTILQTQNLPQEQLVLVKNQIADLAVNMRAPPAQTSTPVSLPNPVAVAPPPVAAPKVSLDSLFGSGALAAIMARASATTQAPTPQTPAPPVPTRSPPPQRVEPQKTAPVPAPADPMALMNMLRQAGMLPPATPAAGATSSLSATPSTSLPFPLPLPGMSKSAQPAPPRTIETLTSDIALKAVSLKQFRPQLLPLLFEAQGLQCTQCGRRFPTNEEGKKRKTAHMDWHFRVNQRSNETEKRGLHRSWLVDEMDWINTRETIDKEHVVQTGDDAALGGLTVKAPKAQYIPVPDDPVLAASVCPICQDKFETRWLDDAQEFVWADAIEVGDRVYHASCHREAFKDGGGTPMYTRSTPEPVLGKRKAEDDLVSLRGKVKVEAV